MTNSNEPQNELSIELTEDIAEGVYSNLSIVGHMTGEFIVDFVRVIPNVPKAKVKSRIVMTPQHAKQLMLGLTENVKKYEATHGVIKGFESNTMPFPVNLNNPKGQA